MTSPIALGKTDGRWRVELLGGLTATSGSSRIEHFSTRAVALLFARLVLFPTRAHGREELIELLWPGVDLEAGRNRLRQALSTLRYMIEPAGGVAGTVLVADRRTLRIHEGVVSCDAREFERALREGRNVEARALYRGELLPGFYDEWVLDERARLQALADTLVALAVEPAVYPAEAATPAAPLPAVVHAPAYLSTFIGREHELARCARQVERLRLVTITGAGGCGKTRLATELAHVPAAFDPPFEAVVFAELADCWQADQLAERLRVAARIDAGKSALEMLRNRFGTRRVLLVLDNFEQLVDRGGAEVLAELLQHLPAAHALVTSRRVLQIAGEHEFGLLPFVLPEPGDDLARLARNPAVALFVDRARGVRPEFHLMASNRDDLLATCRLLEGLPLALEIAASRVRTYSLREMREALTRGFGIVARSAVQAARDPRHASLQAAIGWSWQLLTPEGRVFLGSLTVFRGGFSADDAHAVSDASDTHAVLDALVRDSLLAVTPERVPDTPHLPADGASRHRFHLLESVREFVRERTDPARAAASRLAHRRHFVAQARMVAARHGSVPEAALGNFIEAIQTGLADNDAAQALALVTGLKAQWESVHTPPEALALMLRAYDGVAETTEGFSTFLSVLAIVLFQAGRPAEALKCGARALRVAADDPVLRAEALFAHTRVDWVWKREGPRVLEAAREAVRLAEGSDRPVLASSLSLLAAITLWGLDDAAASYALYERAEAVYVAQGNRRGAMQAWYGRMGCLHVTGRHDEALRLGETFEPAAAALGNIEAQLVCLDLMAASYAKTRRFAESLATAQREARLARRHDRNYNLVYAVWHQGRSLARLRRPEEAAVLMAFAVRYWAEHLGALPAPEQRELARVKRLISVQLEPGRFDALWARGNALTARDGVGLACDD